MVSAITTEAWEKAGQAYADILIQVFGTLPPKFTYKDELPSHIWDHLLKEMEKEKQRKASASS